MASVVCSALINNLSFFMFMLDFCFFLLTSVFIILPFKFNVQNFIDLAGSERASQAMSAGARLKEGCHINRSLLTLGTVIRKLSKGRRQGHINFRDSKLTRILQPCLGGNSRTAIICTLSPARSHVELTRNTLLFACCAKEVTTKARINVVMSDKALLKQLQRELARLETELRTPATATPASKCDCAMTVRKKNLEIQKVCALLWTHISFSGWVNAKLRCVMLNADGKGNDRVERRERSCSIPAWRYHENGCTRWGIFLASSSLPLLDFYIGRFF